MSFGPGSTGRHVLVGAAQLVAAGVVILLVVVGLGLAITRTGPGAAVQDADLALLRGIIALHTPTLDGLSYWATELASMTMVVGLGAAIGVGASLLLRRWWPLLLMALALLGETQLFVLASQLVGRTRPPLPRLDGVLPPTSSFPSGHTSAAICLYGGAAAIVWLAAPARWRWAACGVATVLVVLVAVSRLYRVAHHPSDAVGALVLALPWLLAVVLVLRRHVRGLRDKSGEASAPAEPPSRSGDVSGPVGP